MVVEVRTAKETDAGLERALNYVGGRWVEPTTDQWIDVIDPATARPIGRVPLSTPRDVDQAVQAAKAAFPAWRETPPLQRARKSIYALHHTHTHSIHTTAYMQRCQRWPPYE